MNDRTALKIKITIAMLVALALLCAFVFGFIHPADIATAADESTTSTIQTTAVDDNKQPKQIQIGTDSVCDSSKFEDSSRTTPTTTYNSFTSGEFNENKYNANAKKYIDPDTQTLTDIDIENNLKGSMIYSGTIGNIATENDCLAFYGSAEPSDDAQISFTFALSEDLRLALKDKLLQVSVKPYIVFAKSGLSSQLSGKDDGTRDTATVRTFIYGCKVTDSKTGTVTKSVSELTVNESKDLYYDDKLAEYSGRVITSGQYEEDAFIQVSVTDFKMYGEKFLLSMREVGVHVTVTFSTDLSVATKNDNPSNDPNDVGKTTTCLVTGDDRHASAYSSYAKENDILDVNLVLATNKTNLTLDTEKRTTDITLDNCKDGTMFRKLFLADDDDYIIEWSVTAGKVDSSEVTAGNYSGQAIKFKVKSGDSQTNNLTLTATVSYRKLQDGKPTGALTSVLGNNGTVSISIYVDAAAPSAPQLATNGTFYKNYITNGNSKAGYYTSVQTNVNAEYDQTDGQISKLLISGSEDETRPIFEESATTNKGGSRTLIYYRTTYYGEKVPNEQAAQTAESFSGPIYVYDETDKVYAPYEGRLKQGEKYYKMTKNDSLGTGTSITDKTKAYVRNNVGKYEQTEDDVANAGTSYYIPVLYEYETNGEYTGVYARIDRNDIVTYDGIYLNLVTGEETGQDGTSKKTVRKAGVWGIEFISYDYCGNYTMCGKKYFVKVDITEYEFAVRYSLGKDTETGELGNVKVSYATVADDGTVSGYTEATASSSGYSVIKLRRANRVYLRVAFDQATAKKYKLTNFSVGTINQSTTSFTMVSRKIDLAYETYKGTKKTSAYTFEVGQTFCDNEDYRVLWFTFKEIISLTLSGLSQEYDGNIKEITVTVPRLQEEGNVVRTTTLYYTDEARTQLVAIGEAKTNAPIDAGTYYFRTELAGNATYYAEATGTLTVTPKQPKIDIVPISVAYGAKSNDGKRLGLATVDFDPDLRDGSGRQMPGSGISVFVVYNGKTSLVSNMSNDGIPGYYIIDPDSIDKTSATYLSPQAGTVSVKIKFIPVKGTVNGTDVIYAEEAYDVNGNFVQDKNYTTMAQTCTITIVHDSRVEFALADDQGADGSIKNTTMTTLSGEEEVVKYVEYVYDGTSKTFAYTLTSAYELAENGAKLDLSGFARLYYSKLDTVALDQIPKLTEKQLGSLKYSENPPITAGVYAVKIAVDKSKCNYDKSVYTYIKVKKIELIVDIENTICEYQYETTPAVTLKLKQDGITDYTRFVTKYVYEYFRYTSGKSASEIMVDDNKISGDELRRYTGNPIAAGTYYVRVTIDEENYEGVGYGPKYTIKKVADGNGRMNITWPEVSSSRYNPNYSITYGQPLREVELNNNGASYTYQYRQYNSASNPSIKETAVPGKAFIATVKYGEWLGSRQDTAENRLAYVGEMEVTEPEYKESPYAYYLCFIAMSTDGDGNAILDENFDFLYKAVAVSVGEAELDWTYVKIDDIYYGTTVDLISDIKISATIGVLYSCNGIIPEGEDYYILRDRYVFRYVDPSLYSFDLTESKSMWCSRLNERQLSESDGTVISVLYDDCNPFSGVTATEKHTSKTASTEVITGFNSLGELFAAFMSSQTDENYSAFYTQAANLYKNSLVDFAKNASSTSSGSAIIGINHDYYNGSVSLTTADAKNAIARLFGYGSTDSFVTEANNLVAAYASYNENGALANGCFKTENGSYVFPIAIKNGVTKPILMYVIIDSENEVSVWVSDVTEALKATNFNSSYHTNSTIQNQIYCKNVLFATSTKADMSAAGKINMEIAARFINKPGYKSEYIGSCALTILKKELEVSFNGGKTEVAYKNWTTDDFSENIIHSGFVDEKTSEDLGGTFSFVDGNGLSVTDTLSAGTYTVTYTVNDDNYSGQTTFTLTVNRSELNVEEKPAFVSASQNIVYNAKIKSSVGFLSGSVMAEGGESLTASNGKFVLGDKIGIYKGDALDVKDVDDGTVFPDVGTRIRIYFNFVPSDGGNYATFVGTDDNGGYLETTVSKADISKYMSLSVLRDEYIYKDIICTDENLRKDVAQIEIAEAYKDLKWTLGILNSSGNVPQYGSESYLNAGAYTLIATIDDENYRGEASCTFTVEKKKAYINIVPTGNAIAVEENGLNGLKKPYKDSSQTLEYTVSEINKGADGKATYDKINEAVTIRFTQNGSYLGYTPSAIGYYGAEMTLSANSNYCLAIYKDGVNDEKQDKINSFLIISIDPTSIEIVNIEQVYTVRKTVSVFMGNNDAVCTVSYEKDGVTYRDLPVSAGTYTIYLTFAAYDNNGYEEVIDAADLTDENGAKRGYKLVISKYKASINAPTSVTVTYTGKEGEKITATTQPYGLTLKYKYRASGTVGEYEQAQTLAALGALDAGEYEVAIEIDDDNYKGEHTLTYTVNRASLTLQTAPQFAAYEYNSPDAPEYIEGSGAYVYGGVVREGTFSIDINLISALSVGEHTVSYAFTPEENNFLAASGTVKLTIVKRTLDETFIKLKNGILENSDYTVGYTAATQSLQAEFDISQIYGYPIQNGDFAINLRYTLNGVSQTPSGLGSYTVTAEVSGKNYTGKREWTYKYVITQGTPKIAVMPTPTKTFAIGDKITSSSVTGGKAVIDSAETKEVFGKFVIENEVTLSYANANKVSVTFIPNDEINFRRVTFSIDVNAIGKDSFSADGKELALGKTINGTDFTDKVLYPTFTSQSKTLSETASGHDGNCGAKIKIVGNNATYGTTLGAFKVVFEAANTNCDKCKSATELLSLHGSLTFVNDSSYVPSVGEKLEISYKLVVDRVTDGHLYNNMYGYISLSDIITRKVFTASEAEFTVYKFGTDNYILSMYTHSGRYLASVAKLDGKFTYDGIFASETVTEELSFNEADKTVSIKTQNYEFTNVSVTVLEYGRIAADDILIEKTEKTYDGNSISVEDIGITVKNTSVAVSRSAITLRIYDENGVETSGVERGTYTVSVVINDAANKKYGIRNITFKVIKSDISDLIYLEKRSETKEGGIVYYDVYNSGTHTLIVPYYNGEAISSDNYKAEVRIKGATAYGAINELGAATYELRITVSADSYVGEATFDYVVKPQNIIMNLDRRISENYGGVKATISPSFTTENGESFSFTERGGYSVYYSASDYTKQTKRPTNAGTYTVTIEPNSANYTISSNTVTLTINKKGVRMETAPQPVAIDESGNNLVYGQKTREIILYEKDSVVRDNSGNEVKGKYSVASEYADVIYGAGTKEIGFLFTPYDKNYETCSFTLTIKIAPKTVKIEFTTLTAYYTGSSARNTLKYKELDEEIDVYFEFIDASKQVVEPVAAGVYTLSAKVSGSNYKVELTSSADGRSPIFTINKAIVDETRSVDPRAVSVGVGESLVKSTLTGGGVYYVGFSDPVKGTFSFVESGKSFASAGEQTVAYVFTPSDSINFSERRGTTTIIIGRGSAKITVEAMTVEYGTPFSVENIKITTSPSDLESDMKIDFTCDGITYGEGDILSAGTYYFTCYIDGADFVSEETKFKYVVEKKEIDVDFINGDEVVTTYVTTYGEKAPIDIRMYDANTDGKRTYLMKDAATMKLNVEYRYVSRAGTATYDAFTAPERIGTYDLIVTVKHDNYTATKTAFYRVDKGKVKSIEFDVDTLLYQVYGDGSVIAPIIKTTPSDVNYYVIYEGYGTTRPSLVGSYNLTVYVDDENYSSMQKSAVFKINPRPLSVTNISVKDKTYDGVATLDITASLTGVQYKDEVTLNIKARTADGATDVGEHYVEITECYLSGLHASNYTLEYPTYDDKVNIYVNTVKDNNSASYMIGQDGIPDGTTISFTTIDTSKNKTSVWSKMVGVESEVVAFEIKENNASIINSSQYKICVEIPEQYRDKEFNKDFTVKFDGELKDKNLSPVREGNYITFYASTSSGQVIFETAEFKYGYVVTAAILLIVLIAIIVMFILNPLRSRRSVSDPRAAKNAVKRIKQGNRKW